MPCEEEVHGLAETEGVYHTERNSMLDEHAYRRGRIRILDIFGKSSSANIPRKFRNAGINLKFDVFRQSRSKQFYFPRLPLVGFGRGFLF